MTNPDKPDRARLHTGLALLTGALLSGCIVVPAGRRYGHRGAQYEDDDEVVDAEIVRPSDQRVLDQRALAIVRAAAPFGSFSPAMRKQADQIVITSRFRFTRDEGLETSLSNATQ